MRHTRGVVAALTVTLVTLAVPACDRGGGGRTGQVGAAADTTYDPICVTPGVKTLCPEIPHDVYGHFQNGYSGLNPRDQRHFDAFSWQSFVALNWPVDSAGNRLPAFGTSGVGVVWETYKDAVEVFQPSSPSPCAVPPGGKFLGQMAKNGDVVDPDGDYDEAVGGPLADRNVNFVLYEKKIHPEEVAFLDSTRLNTVAGQHAADLKGEPVQFTEGSYTDTVTMTGGPMGALEIKASWRILQPQSGDDTTRFYHRPAVVYVAARNSVTGRPMCLNVTVGLVGMHIIHKVSNHGTDWIWSSFEHIDNAPDCADSVKHADCGLGMRRFSFYNKSCATCVRNDSLHLAGTGDTTFLWDSVPPYAKRYAVQGRYGNQITRTQAIYAETDSVNREWMPRVKNTVWQNYVLIGSQWMSGDGGSDNVPAPAILRNTTLESFIPDSSSCLGCHQYAYTLPDTVHVTPDSTVIKSVFADFSFLLQMAKRRAASNLPVFSSERRAVAATPGGPPFRRVTAHIYPIPRATPATAAPPVAAPPAAPPTPAAPPASGAKP